MKKMKKQPTGKMPRGPRTAPDGTKYKPVSVSTTRRQLDAKLKEAPKKIKIISGSASTRENFGTSQRRAGSMTSSGLPRTTKSKTAKPKEVKLGKAKAKMIGGIIAVPSKPKSRMF